MRILLLVFCLQPLLVQAAPRVITSIAPLFEVTSAVMQGVGKPQLLIEEGSDAHHYSFKPSQMRLLQQAELVIWIDRGFETGLHKLTQVLPQAVSQLELKPALGIAGNDGHIWYSSRLLEQMAERISAELQRIDPANAPAYQSNREHIGAQLRAWRSEKLEPLQRLQPKFITEHDFLGHFASDSGIHALASLFDSHDQPGSLGELSRLEKQLQQNPVACLITLEVTPSALAQKLALKYRLKIININPAIDTNSGGAGILRRLDRLTESLSSCLI